MNSSKLQEIFNAVDASKVDQQTLNEFKTEIVVKREREQQEEENERIRREAVPQVVPSWRDVSAGTIVVRSEHWKVNNFKPNSKQVGIITDMKIVEDDLCVAVFYPVIHWEGEMFAATNHPLNAACQDGRILPTVTMNANQTYRKKE